MAETIRSRVEKETMVTISVGVSLSREGTPSKKSIKQADETMYQSKTSGKNKVSLHASMRTRSRAAEGAPAKQNKQA